MKEHRNLSPRQEALAERSLYAAVAKLRTIEECRAFFRDLCTPAEIQAMADRWVVVEWLQRGASYREIQRATGVSVTTIGRVARYLAAGNGGYRLAAERVAQSRPNGHGRPGEPHGGEERERTEAEPSRTDRARRADGARHGQ